MTMSGHNEAWVKPDKAKEFKCSVCLETARDAVTHTCGNIFCDICFQKSTANNSTCPSCRQAGVVVPDHRARRDVLNLEFDCPRQCGCKVVLRYKEEHEKKECLHRDISCNRCDQMVKLGTIQDHEKNDCINRDVTCPACNAVSRMSDLENHRQTSCPKRKVPCSLCNEMIVFDELNAHMNSSDAAGWHMQSLLFAVLPKCDGCAGLSDKKVLDDQSWWTCQ